MLSGLLKFILGVFLAIAVLLGSGVAVALYFMNRSATPPPKPLFANDSPAVRNEAPPATEVKATPAASPTPTSEPTPESTPTPTETPETLPPGAYRGRVTWPQGLIVRDQPNLDGERIAGVAVNEEIIILEESQDKNWQKIRTQGEQEGWVRRGNTEKVNE